MGYGQIDRVGKLIPGAQKTENGGNRDPGQCQRYHDGEQTAEFAAAVHKRGILQIPGNGLEAAHQDPGNNG